MKPVLLKPNPLARDHWFRGEGLRLQDFVDQKKVGEQSAQMDGSVQVIDQLGADDGLRENQVNRGERIESVFFQHGQKCVVAFGGLKIFLPSPPASKLRPIPLAPRPRDSGTRAPANWLGCFPCRKVPAPHRRA